MTPPSASAHALRPRKWLGQLGRSGGVSQTMSIAMPLLAGTLLLPQAWLIAHVVDRAVRMGESPWLMLTPLLEITGLLLLRVLMGLAGELAATTAGEQSKRRLRRTLIGDILHRSPNWTAARSSGALATAVIEHVEAMDGYLTRYLPALVQAALLPLAFAVVILPVDWMVALLLLIAAPLIPVFMALAGWGAQAASERQATALSRLSGHFADRLRGITTLKLFGREGAEAEGVERASEALRIRTMRVMRIAFLSSAVLEFFAALGVAGVALYVGLTFLHLVNLRTTPLSLEAGLFCLLMAPEVFAPLRTLAAHYHDQAAAKAAAAELEKMFGELPVLDPKITPQAMSDRSDEVVPSAVTLSAVRIASPTGVAIIHDLDLSVKRGEHVAILGPSGSGKSTLLSAIAGLTPYEGSIRLDGREVREIAPQALRRSIAALGQRPTILATTMADNIRLGRPQACSISVRRAADRAQVTAFAAALPQGLETTLGEGGVGLSGGELQRVALARIYLLDRGLLLLDEPTSHLDTVTETRVLDGLCEFSRGRTMLVFTHSLAVAARMDRCYRLTQGRLLATPRPAVDRPAQRGAA
jgi:ATP-binding cassette subfamily C protein CydD